MDVGWESGTRPGWQGPAVGGIAAVGTLATGAAVTAVGGSWPVAALLGVAGGAVAASAATVTMRDGAAHDASATERTDDADTPVESRLRTHRDRFSALFENVPDPVVYYRLREGDDAPVAEIQAANPAFADVHDVDALAVVGEPLTDVVAPDDSDAERRAIAAAVADGEAASVEVSRRTPDGLRRFIVRHAPATTSPPYESGFALAVDVTERERRERRLAVINRVLRHDLRTEVNVVSGAADTLIDADDPDAAARAAEMLRDHTQRLETIGEKARYVDRLARDPEADDDEVDAGTVARRAVEGTRDRDDATVTVDVEAAPARAGEMLDVAIEELVENALQHVDCPRVAVSVRERDEYVTISVADDGPGISESELAALRRDRETQLEHGSGIGLRLVRWIVEDAGGEVEFDVEGGTTVTLLLPAADQ